MVNDRQSLDLTPFAAPAAGGAVEWRISDAAVPYPEAIAVMEVRVAAPAGPIDARFVAGVAEAFHAAHLKTFGYNYAGAQKVELVNFCVSAFGMIDRPSIPELAKSSTPWAIS